MQYDFLINGKQAERLTNIEWSDDLDNYANSFTFASSDIYQVGSSFEIKPINKDGALKFIITDFEQGDANIFRYSGFDCGFYINQNEIIKQFRNAKISDALKILCNDFGIPVGTIPNISATVKEIFKDKKLSNVFNDLLKLAKDKGSIKDVYFTCARGKFEVLPYKKVNNLTGEMGSMFAIASEGTINAPSIKVSMQDLRNRVLIADNTDKVKKIIKAEDSSSIKKYGLLQEVETVDTAKTNNLARIASNRLKELNKLSKTISMTMLGDYRMHKGVIMPIDCAKFGIKGDFLIKSSRHLISGIREDVAVTLEMR